MLIRDRYKVVQVLRAEEHFAAVWAVDIQDRERPGRLINLYDGPLLHRYGPIYMNLNRRECPAFREFFLERSSLAAVFDNTEGRVIDQTFYGGDRWDWRTRLEMADALLHEAMMLTNLPPEISCAALLSDNVRPDPLEKKVRLRFLIAPLEGVNIREAALLAGDHVQKILPRGLFTVDAELRFLDSLGTCRTPASLYACWRGMRGEIEKERTAWDEQNVFVKGWRVLKRLLAAFARRVREARF